MAFNEQVLNDIANKLRVHSIEATSASNSGHPTSCSSMAEIMSVLFFNEMKYAVQDPRNPNNDRFVLSKGHAAPILYAAWAEAGLFPVEHLKTLRKFDSDLDGHPTPNSSFVDVATGSLGQGLSCAAGMAYTGKYFEKADYRVYCLCGDGETAEGSVWEAMAFASYYKLDNLVNIIDVNRLGQSDPTMYQHDMDTYRRRVEAFGWNAIVVNGHSVSDLVAAFENARNTRDRPTCLLAQTFKGKSIPGVEDLMNWHGKPLGNKTQEAVAHLEGLIQNKTQRAHELVSIRAPAGQLQSNQTGNNRLANKPNYKLGEQVATRLAYGNALVNLGHGSPNVVALDGDVKNSTYSIKFKEAFPDRFVEAFIAEQNLVGVAVGCSTRNRTVPFVSTFAAFFTRAADQIRMAAISLANVKFCGSHVGCSIGEDGPSQMALEDLGLFRSIPSSVVFYPSDAVSTEYAVELAANYPNIVYIRTSRPNTAVIYNNDEQFAIGKAKVVRRSDNDVVTVVSAGVTLHEALKANRNVRVIDVFTVKPLDWQTILDNVRETNNRLLVVEDHYQEGGLGDAVANALLTHLQNGSVQFKHVYVTGIPKSGQPEELLAHYGLDARGIERAVDSFQ